MRDRGVADDKILAVPATPIRLFEGMQELEDIQPHFLQEVSHFFSVYKDLQHIRVETLKWEGCEVAQAEIERSLQLYVRYLRTSH